MVRCRLPIEPGDIPDSITDITLSTGFNQLKPGSIPRNVTTLNLGQTKINLFDQPGIIPDSMEKLWLGEGHTDAIIPGRLPMSLTMLHTGYSNHPILPGTLPRSLTELHIGHTFDQVIAPGTLPSGITTLTFGSQFNSELVPGVLPSSLKTLKLSSIFNKELSIGALPATLQELDLGFCYSHQLVRGVLPDNLQSLVLGRLYTHPMLPQALPQSLTHLSLGAAYLESLGILPESLTSLSYANDRLLRPLSPCHTPDTFSQCRIQRVTLNAKCREATQYLPPNTLFHGHVQTLVLENYPYFKNNGYQTVLSYIDTQIPNFIQTDQNIMIRPLDRRYLLAKVSKSRLVIVDLANVKNKSSTLTLFD
ncbi:hypothetical protein SAMD00019534_111750 [Acytostelium subglobosum LB1]|uniref:hypothetical protein n=1 Tax=Acytostelium subglobosum LB1 TaxID=1410327 RepID=UPI000644FDE1|nr:hypothetical protein SAMD00019534_111750 [Acytostelium subglobosum LB1]GAM27999.1 hypothetical protein SAMD00019534_111750 [Acytostelium subglobosum LB1]|eukprot:XP_012748958.1 hypothetical protein SAMD00019534_111750 [Acytostelium subglobosum LB1]